MSVKIKKNDEVFQKIKARMKILKQAHVKVGVLQDKGAETAGDGETTLAELMAIHEYGAPKANIPAREPLRRALQEGDAMQAVAEQAAKVSHGVVLGTINVEQGLGMMGEWGVQRVKKGIKDHLPPPLQQATIDRKKSDTPLVDTGQLINAITYDVKRRGDG